MVACSRARGGGALGARGPARGVLAALQAERGVSALLAGVFTSPARARRHALVNGTHVLLALLNYDPPQYVHAHFSSAAFTSPVRFYIKFELSTNSTEPHSSSPILLPLLRGCRKKRSRE